MNVPTITVRPRRSNSRKVSGRTGLLGQKGLIDQRSLLAEYCLFPRDSRDKTDVKHAKIVAAYPLDVLKEVRRATLFCPIANIAIAA